MDEVEAVARGMWHSLPGAHPWEDLPDNMREAFRKWARPAIAALDACRGEGSLWWASIEAAKRVGREAGLREAAAVAQRYMDGCDTHEPDDSQAQRAAYVIKADILALIDAGSQTPPGSD